MNDKCKCHQSSHSLQQFPNRLNPSVVTEALDEMYGQSSQSKGETDWKAALSTAGVFVEDLSSNGDTLLIKVKDSDFEYGIYDQKKLEAVVSKLLSDTDEKMWRLLPQKITTAYDAGFDAGAEAERARILEVLDKLGNEVGLKPHFSGGALEKKKEQQLEIISKMMALLSPNQTQ